MANSADEEWEYEYDDVETDDFYIPIDLSNVPRPQKPVDTERRAGHPTLLKSRLRALNAQRSQQQDVTPTVDSASGQEPATLGEAQIIGLHTENPLVMYNGQLLSLQWASTIGTDLFFTKSNGDAEAGEKPLRSLPDVDLLALSSAKLVARVGRLRPRDELFDGAEELEAQVAQPEGGAGDAQGSAEVSQPAPTSFLAKLNAAKAKRGESTRLAISKTGDGTRLVSERAGAVSEAAQATTQGGEDVEMGGV